MARFTFPATPQLNQEVQLGARTFRWDGRVWRFIPPVIRFEDFFTQNDAQGLQSSIQQNSVQPIEDMVTAIQQNAPETLDTFAEVATALDNDPNFAATIRGELSDKADLVNGLIPAGQLPSFVDDVLEFADLNAFPGTNDDPGPENGKIYVAKDTNSIYRWSGSMYVEIAEGSIPNDAILTVEAGTGLDGSGTFTADQATDETITIAHGATSNQASVDNSGNDNFIKSLTIDQFGHVTAISSDEVAAGSVSETLTVTLDSGNWSGTDPVTQTVNVTGILETDNPTIDIVFSGTYNTDTARAIEWNKIYRVDTLDGQITAFAIEAPLINLPIQIKVVR